MPDPADSDPACPVRSTAESPAWLTALRADPAAAAAGIRWLPELPEPPDAPGDWAGLRPVAEVILAAAAPAGRLFLPPTGPGQLVAALAAQQPRSLWIPVGTELKTLNPALAPYRVDRPPGRWQRPLGRRGFIGHTESLGRTFGEIATGLARHPALAAGSWGSAYDDDPWPRPLPVDLPAATRDLLQQHYAMQAADRPRSLTFVTRWSRSLVTLQDHDGALVLDLVYVPLGEPAPPSAAPAPAPVDEERPAPDSLLAAAPADVRWALDELPLVDARALLERLRSPAPQDGPSGSDRVTALLGLAAIFCHDLRLLEVLRWLARSEGSDWALRAAAIALAQRHGYALLLHELCAGETDPELRAELAALIAPDPAAAPESGT